MAHADTERAGGGRCTWGDARSVDSGCRSARAARSASQPGAVHARERQVAGGLVGLGPFGQWAVTRFKRRAALLQ
jgi:hypothetical protein